MSKVQRVPRPLLALLGIVGENPPQELTNEYHASIEMLPMVIAELPITGSTTTNAAATAGTVIQTFVPQGEVWFVDSVEATVVVDGTIPVNARCSIRWDGGHLANLIAIVNVTYPAMAASVITDGFNAANGQPIIARAGTQFRVRLDALVGAANISVTSTINRRVIAV